MSVTRSWLNRELITDAALRVCLAVESRRSMRAGDLAGTVAGTLTSPTVVRHT